MEYATDPLIGAHMIKPLFENDLAAIYCANATEVIAQLDIVDLLLTDPPYCNGYQSNSREVLGSFDKIDGDDDVKIVHDVLYQSWRKLKINRHGYVFGPITPSDAILDQVGGTCEIIWNKSSMSAGDLACPWGVSHEKIWFGVKRYTGKRSASTGNQTARLRRGSVLSVSRVGEVSRTHPTQKPVDLLIQLIEMSSSRGETILDPFMGTGSALIAAVIAGRKSIGIELRQDYCEIAIEHVKTATRIMKQLEALK